MYVSPNSALGYWRLDIGKVDPFLLSMVSELVKPKMTVWDIGTNVGLFSFAAASLGATVLACEADTWLANLIHRSVLMNNLPVTFFLPQYQIVRGFLNCIFPRRASPQIRYAAWVRPSR